MKNEIPTAKFVTLEKYDENKLEGMNFPLVVKPVDAYSSRGVRKCYDKEDVQNFLANAIQISRSKTAVVEEFIEGQELTVEAFVSKGKAVVLCIGCKNKLKDGKFVAYGSLYPANITEELKQEISDTTQKIAESFHLENTPINMQMITDGEHAYVLEFCARTGGFVKYEITKIMSGFDPIKAIVDLHEGKTPEIGEIKSQNKYLMTCYLYCSDGILDRYSGFEEMYNQGIISRYYLVREKGHQFKEIDSNGDRAAGFFVQDDDFERAQVKFQKAIDNLKVLDKVGNNLVRYDLM